jgi:chromosome segregation ATPase
LKRQVFLVALFLTSCSSSNSLQKSEKYQMEMTLHKTRADIEEAKHDLHTLKMELSILEGKIVNHEDQMTQIKKDTFDQHHTKLENSLTQILRLEKKLSALEAKQEEIFFQYQKIAKTTLEMSKALAQGKEKLNELEKSFQNESKPLFEIAKKSSISEDTSK